jgi:hypothetical protein
MKVKVCFALTLLTLTLSLIVHASAQICPLDDGSLNPGKPTTLTGIIRYHNVLREWIGLQLKPTVCGQKELQLTFIEGDTSLRYRQAMSLSGCKVKVTGAMEIPVTSYYSGALYIADGKIDPAPSCHPKKVPPDLSKSPIQNDVQNYQATISVDLGKNAPMKVFVQRTDGKTETLKPWQAYIEADLNGNHSVWTSCRQGFHVETAQTLVHGHREKAKNFLNENTPGLVASDSGPSSITITCIRTSNQPASATSNK